MGDDGEVQEKAEGKQYECGIHRMANEGVWAVCDKNGMYIRFGDDTEMTFSDRKQRGCSEEYTG